MNDTLHGCSSFQSEDYLMHHGIKGQKWGYRRYQNLDGTWTAAGKLKRRETRDRNYVASDGSLTKDGQKKHDQIVEEHKKMVTAWKADRRRIVDQIYKLAESDPDVKKIVSENNQDDELISKVVYKAHLGGDELYRKVEDSDEMRELIDMDTKNALKKLRNNKDPYADPMTLFYNDPIKHFSFSSEDYLQHHGIKGQKWGIRRFQNPDGTLTELGKKRYGTAENLREGLTLKKAAKLQKKQPVPELSEEEKKQSEEAAAAAAIARGDIDGILAHCGSLTTAELNEALNRVNTLNKIKDTRPKDETKTTAEKIKTAIEIGKSAAELAVGVANATKARYTAQKEREDYLLKRAERKSKKVALKKAKLELKSLKAKYGEDVEQEAEKTKQQKLKTESDREKNRQEKIKTESESEKLKADIKKRLDEIVGDSSKPKETPKTSESSAPKETPKTSESSAPKETPKTSESSAPKETPKTPSLAGRVRSLNKRSTDLLSKSRREITGVNIVSKDLTSNAQPLHKRLSELVGYGSAARSMKSAKTLVNEHLLSNSKSNLSAAAEQGSVVKSPQDSYRSFAGITPIRKLDQSDSFRVGKYIYRDLSGIEPIRSYDGDRFKWGR